MPRYEVRILTKKGIKAVLIDGPTVEYVTRIGGNQGRVVSTTRKSTFSLIPGMSPSERYIWLRRMSAMMNAKVATSDALRLMMTSFGGNIKKASTQMLDRVESGLDIPTAMEQDPRNFPVATTALMRAGISGGDTGKAMLDVAEFEYKLSSAQKGSMKEIWNGIGSMFIAGGLVLATNYKFGPMVMDNPMFAHAKGVNVEWTRTAGTVCSYIMIFIMFVLFALGWLGTIGRRLLPDIADGIILRIPFYKDLVLAKNNYVVLYKLGLLVGSGVRIEESLQISQDAAPRGALKTDLKRALNSMRSGKPWPTAMQTLHPTDKAALSTSSDRTDVSKTLLMLATQYSDLYIQRIKTFAPSLGMVAAIFMTIAGGLMFCQTILPMLQLAANVN